MKEKVVKENPDSQRTISGYKGQIKMLQNRVNELEREKTALSRLLGDKDVSIESLRNNLSMMEEQNGLMLKELEEANSMCTTYQARINYYEHLPWYKRIFL